MNYLKPNVQSTVQSVPVDDWKGNGRRLVLFDVYQAVNAVGQSTGEVGAAEKFVPTKRVHDLVEERQGCAKM